MHIAHDADGARRHHSFIAFVPKYLYLWTCTCYAPLLKGFPQLVVTIPSWGWLGECCPERWLVSIEKWSLLSPQKGTSCLLAPFLLRVLLYENTGGVTACQFASRERDL